MNEHTILVTESSGEVQHYPYCRVSEHKYGTSLPRPDVDGIISPPDLSPRKTLEVPDASPIPDDIADEIEIENE